MDFSVGGFWLYAMLGPENFEHYSRVDYEAIDTLKSYSAVNNFCDKEGIINQDFSSSLWNNSFSQTDGKTLVSIVIIYKEVTDLERMIEMGFKGGFTMGLNNLEELLDSY